MPIIDYEQQYETSLRKVLASKAISDANKSHLKRFLHGYKDVTVARKGIFVRHIEKLLEATDDIKEDMHDRDKINKVFEKLERNYSPSYYSTIVNVSLRFVRWLYDEDGNKPKGFRDIKNKGKDGSKRKLVPEDMLTWKDMEKLLQHTNSIQYKALLSTQLDGGFRPSEFIDLNFGDVQVKGKYIIAHVTRGKTGERDVILYRSVPSLQAWLHVHPTKRAQDPLWVIEDPGKSHRLDGEVSKRYTYAAIKKRLRILAEKARFGSYKQVNGKEVFVPQKPLDFYNLRHSACTLSKLENVNPGLAADKFGHSVEYYEEIYGRLDKDDLIKRFAKAYGDDEARRKSEELRTLECSRCGRVNEPGIKDCINCGAPLTLERAMQAHDELSILKEQLAQVIAKVNSLEEIDHAIEKKQSGSR